MANICSTFAVLHGIDDIKFDRIAALIGTAFQNVTSNASLEEMLWAMGSKVDTGDRGTIEDVKIITGKDGEKGVEFMIESKWSPPEEWLEQMCEAIKKTGVVEDITYDYLSEEPGCEIFINTDEDNNFYQDILSVDFDDGDGYCDHQYFGVDDFKSAKELIKDLTGIEVSSYADINARKDEIENKFKDSLTEDSYGYLSVNVFTDA